MVNMYLHRQEDYHGEYVLSPDTENSHSECVSTLTEGLAW